MGTDKTLLAAVWHQHSETGLLLHLTRAIITYNMTYLIEHKLSQTSPGIKLHSYSAHAPA